MPGMNDAAIIFSILLAVIAGGMFSFIFFALTDKNP